MREARKLTERESKALRPQEQPYKAAGGAGTDIEFSTLTRTLMDIKCGKTKLTDDSVVDAAGLMRTDDMAKLAQRRGRCDRARENRSVPAGRKNQAEGKQQVAKAAGRAFTQSKGPEKVAGQAEDHEKIQGKAEQG